MLKVEQKMGIWKQRNATMFEMITYSSSKICQLNPYAGERESLGVLGQENDATGRTSDLIG